MTCSRCGIEFEMSAGDYAKREQLRQRGEEYTTPKRCAQCRWERRWVVDVTCAKCGTGFKDTAGRIEDLEAARRKPLCPAHRPEVRT